MKFVSMAELISNPELHNDAAYRRGYDQGYWSAIKDFEFMINHGNDAFEIIKTLESFEHEKIYIDWRCKGNLTEIQSPPKLSSFLNKK